MLQKLAFILFCHEIQLKFASLYLVVLFYIFVLMEAGNEIIFITKSALMEKFGLIARQNTGKM